MRRLRMSGQRRRALHDYGPSILGVTLALKPSPCDEAVQDARERAGRQTELFRNLGDPAPIDVPSTTP